MAHRIAFLGTPGFAVPALEHLATRSDVEIVLVVTQPDRPAGRGRKMQAPPVKVVAEGLGLPLYQAATLRDASSRAPLVRLETDLIIVAAFGLILGSSILKLPRFGCVNLHASLLPRYRGASPIAAAIRYGEATTGVSLMRMEKGLDTGAVYAQQVIDITDDDTTETLSSRLSQAGASVLSSCLPTLLVNAQLAIPQGEGASCTRPMVKDDGWIDWSLPAREIERHVRAMWPWPRAWTTMPDGTRLQIHASIHVGDAGRNSPGRVFIEDSQVTVECGDGHLKLLRVQLAGGKLIDRFMLASRLDPVRLLELGRVGAPDGIEPLVTDCEPA